MDEYIRKGHEIRDAEHNLNFPGVLPVLEIMYDAEFQYHPHSYMMKLADALATRPPIELPLEDFAPMTVRDWSEAHRTSNELMRRVFSNLREQTRLVFCVRAFSENEKILLRMRLNHDLPLLRRHREAEMHTVTEMTTVHYWDTVLRRVIDKIHQARSALCAFKYTFDDPFSPDSIHRNIPSV